MELHLTGKRALVTGSSRGIGLAIASRLAAEGCSVCLCARGEETLNRAVHTLSANHPGRIHGFTVDLSKRGASANAVERAVNCLGGLDILVCNAGTNRRKPFETCTDEDWDALLDLNLRAPIEAARMAYPYLKQNQGKLVFIASIFGREFGGAGMSLYHTSKSALISLSKSIAVEWAQHSIRVNTIAPGSIWFDGGSWDRRLKEDPEGMRVFTENHLPLGRLGTTQEIADTVAWLVSERAGLLTGTCINVDGGQSRSMI